MNVLELLRQGSKKLRFYNINSHILDSEILLSKVLRKNIEKLLINLNEKVELKKINEFNLLIERRRFKEPIAYILQQKEFWSKNFLINKNILIPRPETELMVEKLVKVYKDKSINILDIGTGSGCILISLLSELKGSRGLGVDISTKAVEVAKINSRNNMLTNKTRFIHRSFLKIVNKKFDLIVSNPPYIKRSDLRNLDIDVKKFEPKIALDGGNDGLDLIRKVIYKTKNILKINGMLALEIGNEQFRKVSKILTENNLREEYLIRDRIDNVRCIISRLIG